MAGNVQKLMANKVNASLARVLTETANHTAATTFDGATTFNGTVAMNTAITLGSGATLTIEIGTASAVAGAVTINQIAGIVGSSALDNAVGATVTITLTNNKIAATDIVAVFPPAKGTLTTGKPVITNVSPGAGSVTIDVFNASSANALNGTILIPYVVLKKKA